ncbi:hypothetical protein [Dongia sp.]|jgi:hypothetical protein|uniref:hypothetical protein n=1 Tax=Dongia sp. TaxID=1977262 RepID=UPI0035B07573
MLTFDDCQALCGVSKGVVAAIAEHEHIPQMAAAEMANYLCENEAGERCIRRYILDDIAKAEGRGDTKHAAVLRAVFCHFVETHPRAARDQ